MNSELNWPTHIGTTLKSKPLPAWYSFSHLRTLECLVSSLAPHCVAVRLQVTCLKLGRRNGNLFM